MTEDTQQSATPSQLLNRSALISIVTSAYNESACIDELASRLQRVFEAESHYEFEVIVVENGSSDDTWRKLLGIHQIDPRFKIVRLSRNFRMDGGITAGLDSASGRACVLMSADLQDPPEMIHEFLRKWEEGYQNVYGVVTERVGTNLVRRINSQLFYSLAGKLTDGRIPQNVSDFRLLDEQVYKVVKSMQEHNRFIRGLIAWTGFKSIGIPMKRPPRYAGESKAHSGVVLDQAVRGIFAHSNRPLRFISFVGGATFTLALLGLVFSIGLWVSRGVPFDGFGTLVSLILLLFGLLTFMLGVLSEYVGLIYEEVKGRPNFVVSEKVGL